MGEASNGAEGIEQARKLKPDVVLMDLLMPVMDGITAIGQLRKEFPDIEVIALTSVLEDETGNRCGARGREVLRQPLEDKIVTISRANGLLTFSANIQLIAGMNPCPCGWYGDPIKPCTCAPGARTKYQKRISGPLLDRIDIHIEVSRVDYEKLSKDRLGESSAEICQRVMISNPHILQRRCMLRSRPKLMAGWRVASQAFASRRHFGIHFTPNGIFSRSPYQADSTASQRPNIGAAARQTEFEAALLLSFI